MVNIMKTNVAGIVGTFLNISNVYNHYKKLNDTRRCCKAF